MSAAPDALDDRIRVVLSDTAVPHDDLSQVIEEIRSRRSSRRRRHRTIACVACVVAAALGLGALATPSQNDVVVSGPATPNATGARDYGLDPSAPLVDTPLPVTDPVEVTAIDGRVLIVESRPEQLTVRLEDARGSSGAMSGDPRKMPALAVLGVGPASDDPNQKHYLVGVTRAEVARVEVTTTGGVRSLETIGHNAYPELRFFVVEDSGERPRSPSDVPRIVAYADDGSVLTDFERILATQNNPRGAGGPNGEISATVRIDGVLDGVTPAVANGRIVWIVRNDNEVAVFADDTRHVAGDHLWWCPIESVFVGPAHSEMFDAVGRRIAGPAAGDLNRYQARTDGDAIVIDVSREVPGETAPSLGLPDRLRDAPMVAPWDSGPGSFCHGAIRPPGE